MRKIFTLLILLLLLPVTALAAEGAPGSLYVAGQQITDEGYYTQSGGNWTKSGDASTPPSAPYFHYTKGNDNTPATLTLSGAKIQGGTSTGSVPYGAGIYAQCKNRESVSLTIELIGNNTITGYYGIYVNAEISADSNGTDASLTITGNGSLEVSGSSYGIWVKSGTGNASLNINDASVVAKTTQTNSGYAGVCVQSSIRATSSPQLSLAVNGGSLTTSASEGNDGIQFYVGSSSDTTNVTTSLTVDNNAIVKAINGIGVYRVDKPTPSGTGIVFDDKEGTVYGYVELQEDLEIGEGETLTIPGGSSLTVPDGKTLTNNGTVTTTGSGSLTNKGTINNSGTLPDSIEGSQPPKITTTSLFNGEVGTAYSQPLAATGNDTITWSVSGTLPAGLTLNSDGTITGTPTTAGQFTFTATATNSAGSDSKEYELTINAPQNIPVNGVTLNPTLLSLFTGGSETLTATVEPGNATNKALTWSTSDNTVATVDENGKVTAVGAGEATITVTTEDGRKTATCIVTVTVPVTGVKLNKETLELFTDGSETLTATVEPGNATNKNVTWSSSDETIATVDNNGTVTAVGAGEATITVTTEDGCKTATCIVTVTVPVTGVTLEPTSLSLFTGDTAPLTATVQPSDATNQNVTWSSDKPEVATVDNGKVTAVGAGEATITATAGGITATCVVHVRKPATVEASGSTNLSFTTDRNEFTLTATVHAQGNDLNPKDGSWTWTVADADVVALSGSPTWRSQSYSISRQAFTIEGTGTTTITAIYDDGTYRGSVDFTVQISKPSPPDPISYYNIYVEDVCDGVEVSTSKQVVREGGSITVYVEKDTANYTFDNFHVYYKEGYYDSWDELKEGTQPGEYPIKNIWTHIYIKAEGAEEKEDPTGIESIEGVKVYTKDGSLYVQTPQREQIIIVSMSGAVVKNEEQIGLKQYHGLQPGIYIVRVGDRAYKVRLN